MSLYKFMYSNYLINFMYPHSSKIDSNPVHTVTCYIILATDSSAQYNIYIFLLNILLYGYLKHNSVSISIHFSCVFVTQYPFSF